MSKKETWELKVNQNRTDRPRKERFASEPPVKEPDWYCNGIIKFMGTHPGRVNGRRKRKLEYSYCDERAGAKTAHPGIGRCRYHGGEVLPEDVTHYTHLSDKNFEKVLIEHLGNPDPTNLLSELASARTLFELYLNEAADLTEGLLAWHASFTKERRGLHDYPLYHVYAIQKALEELEAEDPDAKLSDLDLEVLTARLDEAAEQWKTDWFNNGIKKTQDGQVIQTRRKNLKIDKPMKVPAIAVEATRILQTITNVVKAITIDEKEHYISDIQFMDLMKNMTVAVMVTAQKHSMRKDAVIESARIEGFTRDVVLEFERLSADFAVPRSVRATALRAAVLSRGLQSSGPSELRGETD